jgi:hypothetical protein
MIMPFIVSMCTNLLSGIMIDQATVVFQSSKSTLVTIVNLTPFHQRYKSSAVSAQLLHT